MTRREYWQIVYVLVVVGLVAGLFTARPCLADEPVVIELSEGALRELMMDLSGGSPQEESMAESDVDALILRLKEQYPDNGINVYTYSGSSSGEAPGNPFVPWGWPGDTGWEEPNTDVPGSPFNPLNYWTGIEVGSGFDRSLFTGAIHRISDKPTIESTYLGEGKYELKLQLRGLSDDMYPIEAKVVYLDSAGNQVAKSQYVILNAPLSGQTNFISITCTEEDVRRIHTYRWYICGERDFRQP